MNPLALRYAIFNVISPKEWSPLLVDLLDLERTETGVHAGSDQFAVDSEHHIVLKQSDQDGLAGLGFECATHHQLEKIVIDLEAQGHLVQPVSELPSGLPSIVGQGYTTIDPAGNVVELFVRSHSDQMPTYGHYLTGEHGLGHLALIAPDRTQLVEFYTQILGFQLSDRSYIGSAVLDFMRCNPRHHTLAIGSDRHDPRLLHFSLQFKDLDTLGQMYYRILAAGHTITKSVGRHTNDRMISFYLATPSAFEIELGADGLCMDDPHAVPTETYSISDWGHLNLRQSAARVDADDEK